MRLWTWQNKDFSLANESQIFESLKYSCYLKLLNQNEREKHREAYEKVFQKLRAKQLIWCFTDYRDATSNGSIKEFENLCHCLLWELDISDDKITWYCPVAWETIRTGIPKMMAGVWEIFHSSKNDLPRESKKYKNEFNKFWSGRTTEDLLNLMFLEKPVFDLGLLNAKMSGCSDGAIVIHPLDRQRIIKNPLEIGRWWNRSNSVPCPINNDSNILKTIPCHNCPGR